MMKLVEQYNGRSHHEVKPDEAPVISEGRAETERFIMESTPERHRFVASDGRRGIVYHDQDGQAVGAIVEDIDDDELSRIAAELGADQVSEAASWRQAAEKAIFKHFPPDSKQKGGKVMLTGDMAKAAGAKPYAVAKLSDMTDEQIAAMAKLIGYKGALSEKVA
jgi:hypothetical protein